ncbi:hypothetical protein EON64_01985 [archaeon]|nr:MAG: hypothetical protein EON64_01985 [archaeon]
MQEEEEIELAIQKYIGDEDVLDKLESIKGGPSSAAFVGGVKLQKGDYSSPRPTTSESIRPFSKGAAKTCGSALSSTLPTPTARGRMVRSPQRIFPEAMSISRDQASTEHIRSLAMSSGTMDRQGEPAGYDFQRVFNQNKSGDKRQGIQRQFKSAGDTMPYITVSNGGPPPAVRARADKSRRG